MTFFFLILSLKHTVTYYCHRDFEELPIGSWTVLLDMALTKATHLEVSNTFSKVTFSEVLTSAITSLPDNIHRVYIATHRFRLTSAVITEVRSKEYLSWDSTDLEDPAFYRNDMLLLGAISHEDFLVMLLSETDKNALNSSGFSFEEEYSF